MLVVGSREEYFNAVWVKNEWSRYLEMMKTDKRKTLIPVYSKIDAYNLPEEFSMLQAQSMDKVGAMQDLIRGIKKIIQESKDDESNNFDKETIEKMQMAMEESKNLGNGKYEVTILKENLPIWYYILYICIGAILFFSFVLCYNTCNNKLLLISFILFVISFFASFKRKLFMLKYVEKYFNYFIYRFYVMDSCLFYTFSYFFYY